MIGFVLFSFLISQRQLSIFVFSLQLLLHLNSYALRFCGILNKRGMIKLNIILTYIYFISPYKTGKNMMQGL